MNRVILILLIWLLVFSQGCQTTVNTNKSSFLSYETDQDLLNAGCEVNEQNQLVFINNY